jgi:cysteine desulfurase
MEVMTRLNSPIYLDHNATTAVDGRVREKMIPFLSTAFGNASSHDHSFGWDAAEAVEEARFYLADLIKAKPKEIVFTSGATEGMNLALKGLARLGGAGNRAMVTCCTEHEAVLGACRQLMAKFGIAVTHLATDPAGRIDLDELACAMTVGETALIALMYANNETGTIHPVRRIAEVARAAGALFVTDLAQAAGRIPVDVRDDGIDLAALSAHKMYGPKGVGALFIRSADPRIEMEPLIVGGGQERGLRGGTLNVPGIVGFGEACRIAKLEMKEEAERVGRLRDRLEAALLRELPDVWINGDKNNRLANTTNLGFAGVDARTLVRDMHDIAVSTRSACSSSSGGPSHVLKALGLTDEQAYSCVRFSLGRFTTEQEIECTIGRVVSSVRKLRSHGARVNSNVRS